MKLKFPKVTLPKIDMQRIRCFIGRHKWEPYAVLNIYGQIGGPHAGSIRRCQCGRESM